MSRSTIPFALCLAFAAAAPALAAAPAATLTGAWVRALPGSVPAAGYFTLHNTGTKPLVLDGAQSPDCGMAMLHKSENMGGMAHMDDVSTIAVAPGGTLTFAPGGYHVMCMMPSEKLKPGATTSFTLHFADGSTLTAPFPVKNAMGK